MQSKQSHSRHSSREKVSSNESTHRAGKSIGDASLCGIFVKTDTAPDTVTVFVENLPKIKIISEGIYYEIKQIPPTNGGNTVVENFVYCKVVDSSIYNIK